MERVSEQAPLCALTGPDGSGEFIALSGLQLEHVLSVEIYRELVGLTHSSDFALVVAACQRSWTDLAHTLALLLEAVECFLIAGSIPDEPETAGLRPSIVILAAGRAETRALAEARCSEGLRALRTLIHATLDYAETTEITDADWLERLVAWLATQPTTELLRRYELLGQVPPPADAASPAGSRLALTGQGRHLFPWTPSDDPWRRLLEALCAEEGGGLLVVHARGRRQVPAVCLESATASLIAAEQLANLPVDKRSQLLGAFHPSQSDSLRREALRRVTLLQGPVIEARVHVVTAGESSPALLAIAQASIDDASTGNEGRRGEALFHGGASLEQRCAGCVFAKLPGDNLQLIFGLEEATAIIRTPMPSEWDYPGLSVNHARTAPSRGQPGDDSPLGWNVHRSARKRIAEDRSMRFRHTYIIGQTGTGKSTLLSHMILHDIARGRGVAVLDPHGSLIDQVLGHIPEERIGDVILVDPTDVDYPIGFNVLSIPDTDPLSYRLARDFIIDDLYSFLDRTYDLKRTGGAVFETHFRGMLALLMGDRAPHAPLIPNLMVFRAIYTNPQLRETLTARIRDKDPMLDDFIREIENVTASNEQSMRNIAPYITAKFTRFVSDIALRNMTCQNQAIDMEKVVDEGKILLFHLRKGRFGDQAAGLLASHIVSRVRQMVMRRGPRSNKSPFYLYADEFQIFADQRFAELLAESRKFRLSLTVAHQFVEQLPSDVLRAVLGNVGTTVLFRVGALDADMMEPLFRPTFGRRDLLSLPNFRAYVRSFGCLGDTPFSVDIDPPLSAGSDNVRELACEHSRASYARPRTAVEHEIVETYEAFQQAAPGDEGSNANKLGRELDRLL